jgi:hypothetical protein
MPEDGASALEDRWRPAFRHSAGRLGSQYLTAIETESRLLAWKTGRPDMLCSPPKDFGAEGEWVEIGPGAKLLSFVPREWLSEADRMGEFLLARVLVDGARVPQFALVSTAGAVPITIGARLTVKFAARTGEAQRSPGYWFEPEGAVG